MGNDAVHGEGGEASVLGCNLEIGSNTPGDPGAKFLAVHHPHISLYPTKIRETLSTVPEDEFLWPERKVIRFAYEDNLVPEMDERLRLSFWAEYDRCTPKGIRFSQERILTGICSRSFFEAHYCSNYKIMLLITMEPFEQKRSMVYAHHLSVSEMIRLIKDPTDANSKNGPAIWANKIRVFEWLDQRINGPLPQHIVSKNVNVNVDAPQTPALPQTPEELDQRLSQLMEQLNQPAITPQTQLPVELVSKEAGRVLDAEFVRDDKRRDNSHREP